MPFQSTDNEVLFGAMKLKQKTMSVSIDVIYVRTLSMAVTPRQ